MPKFKTNEWIKRREKMARLVKSGMSTDRVARRFDVTTQTVGIACRNAGGKFTRRGMKWTWPTGNGKA